MGMSDGRPPLGVGDGHDRDPVGVGPVEVAELLVEGAVDGGGNGQVGEALGVEGAHHGVVVDDVAVGDGLVGVDDVADLGDDHADPQALGRREHPLGGNRTAGVAGGEEEHVVAGLSAALGPAGPPPARSRRREGGDGVQGGAMIPILIVRFKHSGRGR